MRKSETYRNEIKSYIVRTGMTMTEVVDYLSDEYGWSITVIVVMVMMVMATAALLVIVMMVVMTFFYFLKKLLSHIIGRFLDDRKKLLTSQLVDRSCHDRCLRVLLRLLTHRSARCT